MIPNLFLLMIKLIFDSLSSVLPSAELPTWITETSTSVTYYVNVWSFTINFEHFLYLLAYFIAFELAILAIFGINAIIKVLRGSG